ncbi:MAG: septation regulator SpoVG [Candidatus Sumerlaeota bacterium]|nr:septation regulator SpoVG [Candidatus Sumerlaeota bacterium]
MEPLAITDVRVRRYDHGDEKLKAFATVTFNEAFIVCDLKVIDGPKGLFVAMPSRKRKDGSFRDIAHPLNQQCRAAIESRVLAAFNDLLVSGGNGSDPGEGAEIDEAPLQRHVG